jgi:NADPH:quinone reductase-like Zn-dependent oxidoreductase
MSIETTQAVRVARFGGAEVMILEETALPALGAEEVLLRVRAAGVGPWDAWIRSGASVVDQPLPLTLGSEVAGVVEAVGARVRHLKPGDEAYGATNGRFTGGYARLAVCEAGRLALKPRALSFVEAASAPVVAVTAWQMLFSAAGLKAGQSVVIHGALGAVGRYAVQLGRQAELTVVATARPGDLDRLRLLGVEGFIDLDSPVSIRVDAALDLVGGESQRALFAQVAAGGALISAVSVPDPDLARLRGLRAVFMLVDVRTDVLDRLTQLFDAGALKPFVGVTLALEQAQLAHGMMAGCVAHPPGKIVLQID